MTASSFEPHNGCFGCTRCVETWPAIPIGQLARANPSRWIVPTTSNPQPSRACRQCLRSAGNGRTINPAPLGNPGTDAAGLSQTRRRGAPDFSSSLRHRDARIIDAVEKIVGGAAGIAGASWLLPVLAPHISSAILPRGKQRPAAPASVRDGGGRSPQVLEQDEERREQQ